MNIIVFSRPVRSGKTTELSRWCDGRNVGGLLMPDVDGVRYVKDIVTGEQWPAQCVEENSKQPLLFIGRFCFYATAFKKGNDVLLKAMTDKPLWLVIDEIGKLELEQKGFYSALCSILASKPPANLLLVVRQELTAVVKEFFGIDDYKLVRHLSEMEDEK